jgi:putative nucleotidyltransferase with HDIG domain
VVAGYIIGAAALTLVLFAHRMPPMEPGPLLGGFLLCLATMVLTSFHMRQYPVQGVSGWVTDRILWSTVLLGIASMQLTAHGLSLKAAPASELSPLVVAPLVAVGLLVSGLLGPAKGVTAATVASIGAGVVGLATPELTAAGWLAASIAAHAVNPLRQRADLMRALWVTTACFAFSAIAVGLLDGLTIRPLLLTGAWAAAAGIGAVAIFWLAIVTFERAFGVVSDWTLLDLINPEQPLLQELMLRAPGTYAHSVMVGNLAEHAARAIGANALLCRAMAYYHDIGKVRRPEFFVENKTGENPHDRLNPALSAKIISAHVKDGLKLAEEHGVPQVVREGIAEHHGTSLISYFYYLHTQAQRERAIQAGGEASAETGDRATEHHFRYPGPRPRTKETAILMLADRVEAITRVQPRTSPGRTRAQVWEIIQDTRDDSQLDDSELNFRDLQVIVDAFVGALGALRHERLEYPGASIEGFEDETSDFGDGENQAEASPVGDEASLS